MFFIRKSKIKRIGVRNELEPCFCMTVGKVITLFHFLMGMIWQELKTSIFKRTFRLGHIITLRKQWYPYFLSYPLFFSNLYLCGMHTGVQVHTHTHTHTHNTHTHFLSIRKMFSSFQKCHIVPTLQML